MSSEDNMTALVIPYGSWGKYTKSASMFYSFGIGRDMNKSSRFGWVTSYLSSLLDEPDNHSWMVVNFFVIVWYWLYILHKSFIYFLLQEQLVVQRTVLQYYIGDMKACLVLNPSSIFYTAVPWCTNALRIFKITNEIIWSLSPIYKWKILSYEESAFGGDCQNT